MVKEHFSFNPLAGLLEPINSIGKGFLQILDIIVKLMEIFVKAIKKSAYSLRYIRTFLNFLEGKRTSLITF